MYEYTVTVLTPTYNRANLISKLFESLKKQTTQNFQWLVIDDGSSDNTSGFFDSLPKTDFEVNYYYKNNGGKHTALNFSHPYIKGEVVVIVDSDDYLLPDAVKTISDEWAQYRGLKSICGMSYFRAFENGKHMSIAAKEDFYIDNDIDYRVNNPKLKGDRCEVVRTDLFKKYPFPVFEGENFISEDMLWNSLALENYDTVYRNKTIYICEYLDGGLSKSGRGLRLKNGNGMLTVTKTYLNNRVWIFKRIKATWLYICYAKSAGYKISKIVSSSGQRFLTTTQLPFGLMLYYYWKHKYLK